MVRKLLYLSISFILVMSLLVTGPASPVFASRLTATSPSLGAAESYSVLAGSIVTNTGPTYMMGDLGISPGIGDLPHYTGFPPGSVGPPGAIHDADGHAAAAQAANTAVFGFLAQPCDIDYGIVQDLTGLSLVPGVYCATAFELRGNMTLEGSGVWIFRSTSTLITFPNSSITGGDPCNVWWRVESSATIGVGTTFMGSILSLTSIALQTGATLNGRALAQTGAVTMDSNTISGPICAQLPTSTATSTATSTVTPTATVTATSTVTPTGTFIPPTNTATATATAEAPTPPGGSEAQTATAAALTATATNLPVVTALPPSGGAPLQNDSSPWRLVIAGGVSAMALLLGVRAYRKTSKRSN